MARSACSRSNAGFAVWRALSSALVLAAAVCLRAAAADEPPEGASGLRSVPPSASANKDLAAAANPWAVRAGVQVLNEGGSAVDAAIAMQMVLTLVEPQSSGIGGGAFLLHWDGKRVQSYDGRETAPMAASEDQFIGPDGHPLKFRDAAASGLSVGVPGVLRMLELVHKEHGRLSWAKLFEPAIDLAEHGFPVSPRLHTLLERETRLPENPAARAYFYDAQGHALPVGTLLKNPALAQTLRAIAVGGTDAFYRGPIAADIVHAAQSDPHHAGRMTEADLAAYQAREREPICAPYRRWTLCGMGPPSSGGISVGQIFGILSHFNLESLAPRTGPHGPQPQPQSIHLMTEAERLAFADRDLYLADSDFVHVDSAALLDPGYLAERAKLIGERSMGEAQAGTPRQRGARLAPDPSPPRKSTSHLSVVDQWGDMVAMTTSIEAAFGSHIFVRGFLLNNELTDFSFEPRALRPDGSVAADSPLIANRVQPGKRPLSSMAPTLVFERSNGRLVGSLGSPGGTWIISFVTKTLVGLLDWQMDVEQAIALPNFGSRNGPTEVEVGRFDPSVIEELQARGHTVVQMPMTSGIQAIVAGPQHSGAARWIGGADPRREGIAGGD